MDTETRGFDIKAWNRSRWAMLSPWQKSKYRGEYRYARKALHLAPWQAQGIINRAVTIATVYGPMGGRDGRSD